MARDFERYTFIGTPIFHSYGVLYDEVNSLRFDVEGATNLEQAWSSLGGASDRVSSVNILNLDDVEHTL